MDGGQHGGEILGGINVINAYDRDIVRNPKAVLFDSPHGSDGGHVIGAEPSGCIAVPVKEYIGSVVSAFGGQFHIADISF